MKLVIDTIKTTFICAIILAIILITPFIGLILLAITIFGIVFICITDNKKNEEDF
jgi:hypothetical protein